VAVGRAGDALPEREANGRTVASGAWLLAIVLGIPFTLHVLYMGQTSLLAVAASTAAVYFVRRDQPLVTGFLLYLASVKPQVSLLLILWFAFRREWRSLAVAALVGFLSVAYFVFTKGPVALVTDWLAGVEHYSSVVFNQIGFRHTFGLAAFLHALGLRIPGISALAFACFGLLWWQRRRVTDLEFHALLLVLSVLFLPAHDYDLVVLLPAVFVWARVIEQVPNLRWVALGLLAILFFPQRFLRPFDIPALAQFRVPVVLLGLVLLCVSMAKLTPRFDAPRRSPEA